MENLIEQEGWTVLGRPGCVWCDRVKELLTDREKKFTYVDISQVEGAVEHLVANGIKTVPQVYHYGVRIGGYEQTKIYLREDQP